MGTFPQNKDKSITTVEYNHLNLPTKILFATGGKIEYFYNATGIKLKKKVTDGTNITETQYLDGFQYQKPPSGVWGIDFFPHAQLMRDCITFLHA